MKNLNKEDRKLKKRFYKETQESLIKDSVFRPLIEPEDKEKNDEDKENE